MCSSSIITQGNEEIICENCEMVYQEHSILEKYNITITTFPVLSGYEIFHTHNLIPSGSNTTFEELLEEGLEECDKNNSSFFLIEEDEYGNYIISGYCKKYTISQVKEILEFNNSMTPKLFPGNCCIIERL